MKYPFMSIVIITHNGQESIGRAIDSVLAQDYPKKHYEVIVVDDGSSDNSATVIKSYKSVRYVGLMPNRGIPGARNAGMNVARGDVYVAFDDDCAAKPDWLGQIAEIYQTTKQPIAGVGGELVDPQHQIGLSDLYISARDSDISRLAKPDEVKPIPGFFQRLLRYFMQRPGSGSVAQANKPVVVEELYGANSSFPMDILKEVGGWREGMNSIEDRDICRRIRNAYPERQFIVNPAAIIMHEGGQNIIQHLRRQYKQGPYNFFFYRIYHQMPPIFPLPIFYLLLLISSALLLPLWLPLILVIAPVVLYYWWVLQAVRQRQPLLLCFAYLQLAEEVMAIIGLLRGLNWQIRRKGIYA
jgi:glycosyltransferase involved in cell wall biosynthesis